MSRNALLCPAAAHFLHRGHRSRARLSLTVLTTVPLLYLLLAYALAPGWWYLHRPRILADEVPQITRTSIGLAGDPLNVSLVGSREEVVQAMAAAGWYPADRTTLRSAFGIVHATIWRRAYDRAPVSNLYLWGHKQDLAFERPEGGNPRQRHHVRFWRCAEPAADGRTLWVGAATYDRSVGLSHLTWQITHHIAPEVDRERELLIEDLRRVGQVAEASRLENAAPRLGRNGGGDRYFSDGRRALAVLGRAADTLATIEGR